MKSTVQAGVGACGLLVAAALAVAQGPGRGDPRDEQRSGAADDLVTRMMVFDKDKDGKLAKAEITDERLLRLFDRADVDKDGLVTKEELTALDAKERISNRGGGFGGFGPPGGGPGGPGMGMGMGGPPRPGEILPQMLRRRLNLNAKQEKLLADLQKEVDSKLDEILTAEQRNELKAMRDRGPGGFGGPGGPGGGRRGGPPSGGGPGGGPPPGGEPPPPPPDQSR